MVEVNGLIGMGFSRSPWDAGKVELVIDFVGISILKGRLLEMIPADARESGLLLLGCEVLFFVLVCV